MIPIVDSTHIYRYAFFYPRSVSNIFLICDSSEYLLGVPVEKHMQRSIIGRYNCKHIHHTKHCILFKYWRPLWVCVPGHSPEHGPPNSRVRYFISSSLLGGCPFICLTNGTFSHVSIPCSHVWGSTDVLSGADLSLGDYKDISQASTSIHVAFASCSYHILFVQIMYRHDLGRGTQERYVAMIIEKE